MSASRLQNHMRLQAALAASGRTHARIGLVTSVDTKNYCAKVELQPGGQETGWLPIKSAWVGSGWGLFAPVPVGAQVGITFLEGSVDVGMIDGVLFSTADAPLDVPVGEFWLVHQAGAAFKLTNDGKVLLNSAAEIDIGNLGATLHRLVTDAFQTLFNTHTHPASGQPPTQQMGATHLTSIVKAN